jgi:hypothetical protein
LPDFELRITIRLSQRKGDRHGKRPDENHQGKEETEGGVGQAKADVRLQGVAAELAEKIGSTPLAAFAILPPHLCQSSVRSGQRLINPLHPVFGL